MNFFDYALRDLPSNLYRKNGNTFTDIAIPSGTSTAAVSTFGYPLVSGGQGSMTVGLGGTNKYSITESRFVAGREQQQFTISCAVLPQTVTGEFSVLSHSNEIATVDGISVDQDNVIFRIKFGAGDVTAKWEYPDFTETYLVHGVYTPTTIKLYVNGDLKSSSDIPSDYPASGFAGTSSTMYFGAVSATNDKALVDAPASYPYALTDEQVKTQFIASRDVVATEINVGSMAGNLIDGAGRRVYDQVVFNSLNGWDSAASTDVSTTSGELIPQVDQSSGASRPGTWTTLYSIENPNVTTLAGIKAEWDGNGSYTVQSSLDGGTTYKTVTNGELIPDSQGIDPAGKTLLVKISFTGGIVDDVSEVRDLTLTFYSDNYIYTSSNDSRKLTINGNVSTTLVHHQPIERNSRPGIHVYGGSMTMPQDTEASPVSIQALEFIVNPKGVTSGSGGYLFDTRPYGGTAYMWLQESTNQWSWAGGGSTTVYINGVAQASPATAVKGETVHILFVFATAFNTAIDIATTNQIADYNLIAAYSNTFTAAQAAQLFLNYNSYPVVTIAETGKVTITESAGAYALTLANWAVLTQQ